MMKNLTKDFLSNGDLRSGAALVLSSGDSVGRLLLVAVCLFFYLSSEARVIIIDPFGDPTGSYPTFQLGYAEAVNGDTIEVRPSTADISGSFTFDRSITVIGFGYRMG